MTYEWDEVKRLINLQQHGLDFNEARQVYAHPDKVTLVSPTCMNSGYLPLPK